MEDKIKKELKRIEKQMTKIEKDIDSGKIPDGEISIVATLKRLDGEFAAYMNVLKMIKEGAQV